MAEQDIDFRRGVWRRVWSSYLRGKRINAVSMAAEAYYWRLTVAADDFGNLEADPFLLHAATSGRRKMTPDECVEWTNELIEADLLDLYEHNGDDYVHVKGWVDWQPAGRNGKRVRRFPAYEGEETPSGNDYNNLNPQMRLRSQGDSYRVQRNPNPVGGDKTQGTEQQDDRGIPNNSTSSINTNNSNINTTHDDNLSALHEIKALEKQQFIVEGFERWKQVMELGSATQLTPKRQKQLGDRWKDTTLGELYFAIDGCYADDFSMARGKYENDNQHNDILLICRDRAKVEFFMAKGKKTRTEPDDKRKRQEDSKKRWSGK